MVEERQVPAWLVEGYEKPVAVLGAGVTGRAVVDLLNRLKIDSILYDERGGEGIADSVDDASLEKHRMVVVSPGFSEDHRWVKQFRSSGKTIVNEFDLGAVYWQGPIIAVTGTNGKTTLTEFLTFAFRSSGIEAVAVGNIGEPLCSALAKSANPESIAVCEISSFQSGSLEIFKADHVLWTNFDEDHLDRHGDLRSYFESKYNLLKLSGVNTAIYGSGISEYADKYDLPLDASGEVEETGSPEELGLTGSVFETQPELRNYLMARALWQRMGLSENELVEAAHSFKKSPHRMELIRTIGGVDFWDDSKATNFHAVYGGLSRFKKPVIWIGGGKKKGGDITAFAERLSRSIERGCLIGETSDLLEEALSARGIPCRKFETLEEAVESAFAKAVSGQHILLSPGFASFDMFRSYSERGEVYRKAVNRLGVE